MQTENSLPAFRDCHFVALSLYRMRGFLFGELAVELEVIKCRVCEEEKPLSEFYKRGLKYERIN